jgi:hypothetical protein
MDSCTGVPPYPLVQVCPRIHWYSRAPVYTGTVVPPYPLVQACPLSTGTGVPPYPLLKYPRFTAARKIIGELNQ